MKLLIRIAGHDGDTRIRKRFAWLPTTIVEANRTYLIWLEHYIEHSMWVSKYKGFSGWVATQRTRVR
jgi:hypothetical protein